MSIACTDSGGLMLLICSYPRFLSAYREFSPLSLSGPPSAYGAEPRGRDGRRDGSLLSAGRRRLCRFAQSPRGGQGHAVGHGLNLLRLVVAGVAIPPGMPDQRVRRQEAEISLDQTTIRVPAPRRSEGHLDIGLGNIDVEIGFDRVPDH